LPNVVRCSASSLKTPPTRIREEPTASFIFPEIRSFLTDQPVYGILFVMKPFSDSDTILQEPSTVSAPPTANLSPDDDFDKEELGQRQPEACSLDEGCEKCQ
jgi:hypothetical protein